MFIRKVLANISGTKRSNKTVNINEEIMNYIMWRYLLKLVMTYSTKVEECRARSSFRSGRTKPAFKKILSSAEEEHKP